MDLDRILFENKREVTTKDVVRLLEFLEKEKEKKHFKENSEEFKNGYNDVIETICVFFEDQLYFYRDESFWGLVWGWCKNKNGWFCDIVIVMVVIVVFILLLAGYNM